MLQIPGIFGIVTYWQFAKSIRLLVFVATKFLATNWRSLFLATNWRSFGKLSGAIRVIDRFADEIVNLFTCCQPKINLPDR